MPKFKIIGGYTVVHYRSRTYQANSRQEAVAMAKSDIEQERYCYYEWEVNDAKETDDFDIVEVLNL